MGVAQVSIIRHRRDKICFVVVPDPIEQLIRIPWGNDCAPSVPQVCPKCASSVPQEIQFCAPGNSIRCPRKFNFVPQVTCCPNCAPKCAPGNSILWPRCAPSNLLPQLCLQVCPREFNFMAQVCPKCAQLDYQIAEMK